MNIALWILAGGLVGWLAVAQLHLNASRGLVISAMIGAAGAFFGGQVLAPMISGAAVSPGGFSALALLIASASAIACLSLTDMVYERFGF